MRQLILKLSFFVFSILIFKASYSQTSQDVIHLTNGEIRKGKVVEVTPDTVKIEIVGGNLFIFPMTQVHKILKEDVPHLESESRKDYSPKRKGFVTNIAFGLIISPKSQSSFNNFYSYNRAQPVSGSIQVINGYTFAHKFFVGAGVGLEGFGTVVLPVFADLRYSFLKGKTSPFVYVNGGHCLALDNQSSGGLMGACGIGIKRHLGESAAFNFHLGYRYQQINYQYYDGWQGIQTSILEVYNRFAMRVSFQF